MRYLIVILLAGCSMQGIKITAEERDRCARETCTVWTETELQILIHRAAMIGAQSCRRGTAI